MRIANVVLNDFTRDNRVLKVAALLQKKWSGCDCCRAPSPKPSKF